MLKSIGRALGAGLISLVVLAAQPALAQTATSLTVKDGAGTTQTMGSFDISSKRYYGFGLITPLGAFVNPQLIIDQIGALTSPDGGSTNGLLRAQNTLLTNIAASEATLAAAANDTTPSTVAYQASATSGTPTLVAFTTTSTLLLAANPLRLGCTIVNDTTAVLLLKGSATASSTSYQWPIDAKTTIAGGYECPANWKGPVYGIWIGSGAGNAIITERTQ